MDREKAFRVALTDAEGTFTALRDQLAALSRVKAEDRAKGVFAVLGNYKDLVEQLNGLADAVGIERRVQIELIRQARPTKPQ